MSRKDALIEELISHMEVRGELDAEGNAATERAIAAIQGEIESDDDDNRFIIWLSGYSISHALAVERIATTDKAVKFSIPGTVNKDGAPYTFFMPKKALVVDTNEPSIVRVPRWFTVDGYLGFLFNRFASHYSR